MGRNFDGVGVFVVGGGDNWVQRSFMGYPIRGYKNFWVKNSGERGVQRSGIESKGVEKSDLIVLVLSCVRSLVCSYSHGPTLSCARTLMCSYSQCASTLMCSNSHVLVLSMCSYSQCARTLIVYLLTHI